VSLRRWLLAGACVVLVVTLGVAIAVYWSGHGGNGAGQESAQQAGLDAPRTDQNIARPPAGPSRSSEVDPFVAYEEERLAAEAAEAFARRLAEAAAAYAAARAADESLAADVINRWGGGGLLMALPSIDVTAAVSMLGFERDGRTPATPNTPWGVGWYDFTEFPGTPGNAVFSGHVDWYTGAPAVFGKLRNMQVGDPVYMVLADATPVVYEVETTEWVDPGTADVEAIFGVTEREAVTFITCGGTWNAATHDYSHRLIVRAYRVR
jgi:LPXTG-site transpeptidase (sortase) family protein